MLSSLCSPEGQGSGGPPPPSHQPRMHGHHPSAALSLEPQPSALSPVNPALSLNGLPSESEKSCEHTLETPKQSAEMSW